MRLVVLKSLLGIVLFTVVLAWIVPTGGCARSLRRGGVGFSVPFLATGSGVGRRLRALFGGTPGSDVEQLKQRVVELELELADLRSAGRERNELRALLDLPQSLGWRYVFAPVVARDPATAALRFRIGVGSREGVQEGAAVLSDGQVVGRVTAVDQTTALVATVAAADCRLSVVLDGNQATGVLTGAAGQGAFARPNAVVDFLPRDRVYAIDQWVLSSGLGDSIPKGFRVGRVTSWSEKSAVDVVSRAYARIRVEPLADIPRLQYVAVLIPISAGYRTTR